MVPERRVVAIDATSAARRRLCREVDDLAASAIENLVAVRAGELVYVHGALLDVSRAVRIVLAHALDIDEAS
jgi:hypothetical protein